MIDTDFLNDVDPAPVATRVEPAWRKWLPTVLFCVVAFLIVLWLSGRMPTPGPGPNPSPIDVDGLHVLIVEETEDRPELTDSQRDIFTSTELREWLAENTVDEGGSPAYRMFDDDMDLEHESEVWQELRDEAEGTPWIVAASPEGFMKGPIPANTSVEKIIEQLEELRVGK